MYNPDLMTPPACILWPDRTRQWEGVISILQAQLPELLILGDYEPDNRTGPAIWLRCAIDAGLETIPIPEDRVPIIYLPGVSRQDLRAVEDCPDRLKPLAELQYRGVIWSQISAKDWTVLAFIKSNQGGLGLDVAQDNASKNAMLRALHCFLDEDQELLKGKRLDTDYFNTLVTGGDPTRDILQWINLDDVFEKSRGENMWKAFVDVCSSQLGFNPKEQGVLSAAAKLAAREGPWQGVWERFCEAPKRYPNIPLRISTCRPPREDMLWLMGGDSFLGWPQWNEDQEKLLREALVSLTNLPAPEARKKLTALEKAHGYRRSSVWAELGEAPLAWALEHLAVLAHITSTGLNAGNIEDLQSGYSNHGWLADNAVIRSLEQINNTVDMEAVSAVIRSVYKPWLQDSARYLQELVDKTGDYPGKPSQVTRPIPADPGECLLFVDGLRFDIGKRLRDRLEHAGFAVQEKSMWCPLPSVTGTGKPAVAPIHDAKNRFCEEPEAYNFQILNHYQLTKAIEENGYQVLGKNETGNSEGTGWCAFGDIDHEGHDRGWKLAKHIDGLLDEIMERITILMDNGWNRIRIVTDHGWLLLPGGLPKIELPSELSENKWGRCASLKQGASSEERLFPWYWNPTIHFALADGISCFKNGEEYAHGGLSLQECLTLHLVVTRPSSAPKAEAFITDVVWRGLRCKAAVDGNLSGLTLDIRTNPGNAASSV
ncbi:MAG: BREX-1 system phosphatase PglZ type B, partial [Desulfoplanes sp.]|nr:BREX-1 system phosphatase PglZ type B [Desulfoplanes sp.]